MLLIIKIAHLLKVLDLSHQNFKKKVSNFWLHHHIYIVVEK